MFDALKPGGGVELKQLSVTVPGEGGSDDEKREEVYEYLELPDGVEFRIPTKKRGLGRRLAVRPYSPRLFHRWWAQRSPKEEPVEIVVATPGIGKSMFLLYALYRLAQAEWSGRIVMQYTEGSAALFGGDEAQWLETGSFGHLLLGDNTVYLCDGSKKGDLRPCSGPLILVSSPAPEVYKRASEKDYARRTYTPPVCSLGEMLAMRELCFPDLSEDSVSMSYN